jgi:branched-chain amino acid transport system substrate-binding protein
VVGACGTSSNNESEDSGSSSASAGDISQESIDEALAYTGGSAGQADSSLDPLVIGYTNQEGGVPSFPGQTKAVEAAVQFINEHLGGVEGHPVELDKCLIQAEEDGQKCASQFLANDAISIANLSVSVVGNGAFYKLIDGKFPTIVSVVGAEADYVSEHVYEFDGGGTLTMEAQATDIKDSGAKDVAIISSDNPAGKFIISQVLVPKLEAMGVEARVAYVSDAGTTPDYVSALQSIDAAGADAINLGPATPQGCVSAYQAMEQLGIEPGSYQGTSGYACSGDPIPEALQDGPEGFVIRTLADNPLLEGAETNTFREVMTAYGAEDSINAGNTQKAFSDMLTIVKFATEIGFDDVSGEAFEQQILDFRGPAFMVPGEIECGWLPEFPGTCGKATSGSTVVDGTWEPYEPYEAAAP